jgi:hypothetical protein
MSLFRTTTPFLQNNGWLNQSQNALRYNTSQIGSVLPLCFGTVRQAINLVALGDYMGPGGGKKGKGVGPLPLAGTNTVQSGKGGGGKGKGKSKKSQDFTVDLAVALCQGPITFNENNQVFANSSVEPFSATADGAGKGTSGNQLNFYIGTDGQDIIHDVGASGVNYSGTCVVTATPMDLGPSPAIPNLSFEINALLFDSGGEAFPLDANPGNVIQAFLTDPRYGCGFPVDNLDTLVVPIGAFGNYCQASGLLISVSLDGQQRAAQWLDGLCKLLNTAIVCSGELLKFIPYGDIQISNNGASWIPNLVPVYSLTDADFIPWHPHQDGSDPELGQDDPILVTRTNPADAFNWYSIEYLDRANYYNSTILAVYDQGMIDQYGLRIGDSLPGKCFANAGSAQVSAQLLLQRTLYIRNTYKFQIGWDKALLEPMDIVLLTGSAGDAYLNDEAVRVLSIEENDNGDLTVEAEEVVTGHSRPVQPATSVNPAPETPNCANNLQPLSSSECDFLNLGTCGGDDPTQMTISQTVTFSAGSVALVFLATSLQGGASTVGEFSAGGLPFQRRTGSTQIMETYIPQGALLDGHQYGFQEIWWCPIPAVAYPDGITVEVSVVFSPAPTNGFVGIAQFLGSPDVNNPWAYSTALNARNNVTDLANVYCPTPGDYITDAVVAQIAFAGVIAPAEEQWPDWSFVSGSPLHDTIANAHGQFDTNFGHPYNPQQLMSGYTQDETSHLFENRICAQVCGMNATPAQNGLVVNQVCSCFPTGDDTGCATGVIGGSATALGGGVPFPWPSWMMLVDILKCGGPANPTPPSPEMSPPAGYTSSQLIYDDTFASTSLNSALWNPWYGQDTVGIWSDLGNLPSPYSGVNNPGAPGTFQLDYTDPFPAATATSISGNHLVTGSGLQMIAAPDSHFSALGYTWASAAVSSYGKMYLPATGGYVQFRAQMPDSTNGAWPALWFLSQGGVDPEIDLHEGGYTASGGAPNVNYMLTSTLHAASGDHQISQNVGFDLSAAYHIYGMEYNPGNWIKIYLDGTLMVTWTNGVGGVTIPTDAYEVLIGLDIADAQASGFHSVSDAINFPGPYTYYVSEVQIYS